ncbi:MAG: DUF1553 domain-containing protein, partial [Planctomycetaceae bacterium]
IRPAGNSLPTLTDNGWHHVVFTSERDGQGRVFLDGRKVGEVSIADVSRSARFSSPRFFRVGSVTNQFRGDIDDVAIWNRVLSPAEILRFFTQAVDPERGWNVSQVEQHTKSQKPAGTAFTYTDAAGQGLVPSLVRRFVRLLNEAEEDSASPVHSLVETPPETVARVQAFVSAGGNTLQKQLDDEKLKLFVPGTDAAGFYPDAAVQRLAVLTAESLSIEKMRVPDPVMVMAASDTGQPGDLPVYIAGDRRNPGPVAYRGVPRLLSDRLPSAVDEGRRLTARQSTIPENRSGRLELARWLTSADHPLTARVFVNRVWLHHSGEGLVSTPDNFGRQGERPSHPELLDWLARRFMGSGWSVKLLHRQIILSSTYRQTSRRTATSAEGQTEHPAQSVDAGNRLLWRMNRRRLEGEALRDALLAVSGQLDRRLDGTVNQWKAKMFSLDDTNAETANYSTFRRSLYLPVVRGAALHEMLQLFDFGDPNSIVARRDVTTVAPQALFLMNSPFVMEQA